MRMAQEVSVAVLQINTSIWNIAATHDPNKKAEYKVTIEKIRQDYREKLAKLKDLVKNEPGQDLLTKLEDSVAACKGLNNQVLDLAFKGKEADAIALYSKDGKALMDNVDKATEEFLTFRQKRMVETEASAIATSKNVGTTILIAAILVLVIGIILSIVLTSSITKAACRQRPCAQNRSARAT